MPVAKLADLKIGVRLGAAFGAVLVLPEATAAVAEVNMAQTNARTDHLLRHDHRLVAPGMAALDNTRGSVARVFQLVGDADPLHPKTGSDRLDIHLAEVDKAPADLDKAGLEGGVREVSDSMAAGSAQIATGSTDLIQRTESQAGSLQQTAASMRSWRRAPPRRRACAGRPNSSPPAWRASGSPAEEGVNAAQRRRHATIGAWPPSSRRSMS